MDFNINEKLIIQPKDKAVLNVSDDFETNSTEKIFLTTNFLSSFFEPDLIRNGESIQKLSSISGIQGLAKKLSVSLKIGLIPDTVQFNERIDIFGKNLPIIRKSKSIWELIKEQFEDLMLRILTVAAIVSLIIGIIQEGAQTGWMEGFAIFIAIIIIVSVSSTNNYLKEKQFNELNSKKEIRDVKVLRNGEEEYISVFELTVGDILFLEIGEILPVDGILINSTGLKIDESSITGETDLVEKELFENQTFLLNESYNVNPFIISGSKVMEGVGKIIVCQVGENTEIGKMKLRLQEEQPPTPLQLKLERVANDIGKIGIFAAIITFLALFINLIIKWAKKEIPFVSTNSLSEIVNFFMLSITIIVVAVPEGLPLAVTISLAYSVSKMKDENNLVRHLSSCEIMGGANNICSDKTGTITQNKMTVTKLYFQNKNSNFEEIYKDNFNNENNQIDLLCDVLSVNSSANIKFNNENNIEHIGNKTECALLELTHKFGVDYKFLRKKYEVVRIFPFSSEKKRMISIIKIDNEKGYLALIKGASEIILQSCSHYLNEDGEELPILKKKEIETNVIDFYAHHSLRTIGISFKRIPIEVDINLLNENYFETEMNLIAIAGIEDPLREDVINAIDKCKKAGIIVRMVTGDNLITAVAIAKKSGIIPFNDLYEENNNENGFLTLEGKKFRNLIGGLNEEGRIKNPEIFKKIALELRVLARSTPEDKYLLVAGLKELNNVVAVTGDGTNDAPALKKADVGFAMGICGTEVAKEASDIILLDDNFSSIITACKWGRNIYDSIRKFIQFQLTVNIVALFIAFLGAVVLSQSPLNTIEMLWVNLIMDTFASLALATDPPNENLLKKPPYSRNEYIVNGSMWRNIFGHSLYQIFVLCLILFGFPGFFGIVQIPNSGSYSQDDYILFTIVFHTFVLMQIFNEINCRVLGNQINIFKGIHKNWLFPFIIILSLIVQYLIVQFGGRFVQTSPLTLKYHLICLGFGSFSLIYGLFLKLIPGKIFNKVKIFKESEDVSSPNNENKDINEGLTSSLRRKASSRIHLKYSRKRSNSKDFSRKDSNGIDCSSKISDSKKVSINFENYERRNKKNSSTKNIYSGNASN